MSGSRKALANLHQSLVDLLQARDKAFVSEESIEHEDPYVPLYNFAMAELRTIKSGPAAEVLPRIKGLEQRLAQWGLAEKAGSTNFEDPSPGSQGDMPEVSDPNQMKPTMTSAPLPPAERPASIAVPGTENPNFGINAFSGTVGGGPGPLVPTQQQGQDTNFAARDKGTPPPLMPSLLPQHYRGVTIPNVSFADIDRAELENGDITLLARSRKANPGVDNSKPAIQFRLSSPLDESRPSDRYRREYIQSFAEENQKSEQGRARDTKPSMKIGATWIF